jgi:hypothetical protein
VQRAGDDVEDTAPVEVDEPSVVRAYALVYGVLREATVAVVLEDHEPRRSVGRETAEPDLADQYVQPAVPADVAKLQRVRVEKPVRENVPLPL